MDFDPGFHEEMYDDMPEELEHEEPEGEEVEYDMAGNVVAVATAAGFGYHMSQDELDERKIAEEILERRDDKKGEPVKVSLSHRRKGKKGHQTPFDRYADKVARDPNSRGDEIEYTLEEQLQIIRSEGE